MNTDPAIRYVSLGVICAAFLGFLAVIIHGYWIDSSYAVPPLIATVLASAISIASTLLGVHVGTSTTVTGIKEGNSVTNGTNGYAGAKPSAAQLSVTATTTTPVTSPTTTGQQVSGS